MLRNYTKLHYLLSLHHRQQRLSSTKCLSWTTKERERVSPKFQREHIRHSSALPSWATFDVAGAEHGNENVHHVCNLLAGQWSHTERQGRLEISVPHPLRRDSPPIFTITDLSTTDLKPFLLLSASVPKYGLHNPLFNTHRYLQYGDISRKAGEALLEPQNAEYFAKLIQTCVPKSKAEAMGEVINTAKFLHNFGGDNVRFLARSSAVPGDYDGQVTTGYRWPLGAVCIISPFNFPLKIPALQLMGALYMGNRPVLKPAEKGAVVMEQFVRFLHSCGDLPLDDLDLLNCRGVVAQDFVTARPLQRTQQRQGNDIDDEDFAFTTTTEVEDEKNGFSPFPPIIRLSQFTGSSRVATRLSQKTCGRVKLEDAGLDWKILGPMPTNLPPTTVDYVAWQSDQDAYAASGQKCSAQSLLFCHKDWVDGGLFGRLEHWASRRCLDDLTVGPILTHTTEDVLEHLEQILQTAHGSRLLFGGVPLQNGAHFIPDCYGAVEPTAVWVPLEAFHDDRIFDLCCRREVFAPFQIVTTWTNDEELQTIVDLCNDMSHHLTAAVVSDNPPWTTTNILSRTVNGTTYTGIRGRTTGAPQNHFFGPLDVRGASIGTAASIQGVWSCHREVIEDDRVIAEDWIAPPAT